MYSHYCIPAITVSVDKNKAYEATLRQTVSDKALQELVDNTTPTYDYPQMDLNNLETEPNEAYATVATQ